MAVKSRLLYGGNVPMRVAGFMSGSGTNLVKNIERSLRGGSNYRFVVIFTDTEDGQKCKAREIASKYGLPCEVLDITKFCNSQGYKRKIDAPMSVREQYDSQVVGMLKQYKVDCIALCGYMSIITRRLIDNYGLIVNVHPADLSVKDEKGARKYIGMHVVRDAMLNGERFLHSTTHIVREKVDCGEILLISKPVAIDLPSGMDFGMFKKAFEMSKAAAEYAARVDEIVRKNQSRLKELGDWVIYPMTLEMIASGRFGIDNNGVVCVDGAPTRDGYRLQ